MDDRLEKPRRLSSQVWLLTIPPALISFERQQAMPKLPIGPLRFAGLPLVAAGVALAVWTWRNPEADIPAVAGPAARLTTQPATLAGILVVAGAGLLLRSAALTLYALAVAATATTNTIHYDEPLPSDLLGLRE